MAKTTLQLEKPQRRLGLKGMIAFIILMDAFIPLSNDLYLPAMPTMGEHLGTTDALVQLTITIFFFSYAIGMLVWGPLSDKYGRKRPLIAGFLLYSAATALCMLAWNIEVLLAARLFQGVGAASATAISFAMVKDCFSGKTRETVLALVQTISGFGPILAPVIGSWILLVAEWREMFLLLLLIGLVGIALTLFYDESLPAEERLSGSAFQSFREIGVVMKNRSFVWIVLVYSIILIPFYAYINMSSYIFVDFFGESEQVYSYYYAAICLLSMIGPYLYIRFMSAMDKNLLSYLCFAACVLAGAGIVVCGTIAPVVFSFLMFVFYIATNILRPFSTNLILEQQRHDVGTASSVMNMSYNLFGCLGMLLASLPFPNLVIAIGVMLTICSLAALVGWWGLIHSKNEIRGLYR